MGEVISGIWYANSRKAHSLLKGTVTSDKGSLELAASRLVFSGHKGTINAQPIAGVRLARQAIPWLSLGVVTMACIAFLAAIGFSWAAGPLVIVACDATYLVVAISTKWVVVQYLDRDGTEREAYFAVQGWGGILGGTYRLFARIMATAQTPAPNEPAGTA